MAKLDLLQWRRRYGEDALCDLWARAGFTREYRYQVMNGHRRISLKRARILNQLDKNLDVVALVDMKDTIKAVRAGAHNGKKQPRVRRAA